MDAALPLFIQRMLQPDFYPHPVQVPVQLLQTHISYILLTGDFAYKVKKATQFGFLDFSTLERRAYFCQEELRLNHRLSPDLYLAVLPIYQSHGNYCLNPPSPADAEIIDYALQMRQFDQEGLLSHLFQAGKLTPAHLQRLGRVVAQFHASAATNSEIQAYGTYEAICSVDEENYAISKAFIPQLQTAAQFEQTRTFTQHFWQTHQDELRQRLCQGKIRECHGDLHLNNVCLYQDRVQIFDCIEFCPEFRNIDVIYDVAFMVMDLDAQGRPDLANLFLNTYLETSGDYEGAVLLPAYLSMRATIRGNVHSLTGQDLAMPVGKAAPMELGRSKSFGQQATTIAPSQQADHWQQAKEYFRLAYQYTQRSQGQIVLMSGLSGSGKSTVARHLATQMNAIHIRSDALRKHLAGIPLYQSGTQINIYTPTMTQQTYERLADLGLLLAQAGWTVILDAKYDQQAERTAIIEKAASAHLPVQILYCTAPLAVLRSRLDHRSQDISDATAALLTHQEQAFQAFTPTEQQKLTHLNTNQDWQTQVASFLKPLAKKIMSG
ncbi:MAG: AAA family ATPase [Acaryochloris sp. RU_4_1]|nr:AAA family ATPase [Acaryochloris sp. SU_5_25]NJM67903.1 AAA family ATPase [Acaryochloris sp. RU_4_1]NJR54779.1 AAA family ATPase [Acaryochloris sp. CRU_2_0]